MANPLMSNLFEGFKKSIENIKSKNEADPNEATAPRSVFDKINDQIEKMKEKAVQAAEEEKKKQAQKSFDLDDYVQDADEEDTVERISDLKREINQLNNSYKDAQRRLRADFENKMKPLANELNGLKTEMKHQQQASQQTYQGNAGHSQTHSNQVDLSGMNAVTDSMGGALTLHVRPDLGSLSDVKIPHGSTVKVLGRSENEVIIDGKKACFCKVEFNNYVGYVWEGYLRKA